MNEPNRYTGLVLRQTAVDLILSEPDFAHRPSTLGCNVTTQTETATASPDAMAAKLCRWLSEPAMSVGINPVESTTAALTGSASAYHIMRR